MPALLAPLLAACLLLTSRSENLRQLHGTVADVRQAGGAHEKADPRKSLALDKVVMRRGIEELSIATGANEQAKASAMQAKAAQENFLTDQAVVKTEASYLTVKPLEAEARAQLLTVRRYEALAELHARHASKVLLESRYVPEAAAEQAVAVTSGWIKSDARKSAEASSAKGLNRADRLAAAVASAAEPYHLALLRNQKFCEETYSKAKTAHSSAVKLITDSKALALKAQELQAAGMGVDARQTFGMASGMISEAETLRQWGVKLYGQANTACGTSAGYQLLEQQAAANAAATTIMNAPMKLPPAA